MLIVIIGFLVFLTIASLVIGLGHRSPSVMEARIQYFKTRAVEVVEGEAELSVPCAYGGMTLGLEALAYASRSARRGRGVGRLSRRCGWRRTTPAASCRTERAC